MKRVLSFLVLCAMLCALLLSASSCGERNDTIDPALLKGEYNQEYNFNPYNNRKRKIGFFRVKIGKDIYTLHFYIGHAVKKA